jgi:hypothetical protein
MTHTPQYLFVMRDHRINKCVIIFFIPLVLLASAMAKVGDAARYARLARYGGARHAGFVWR